MELVDKFKIIINKTDFIIDKEKFAKGMAELAADHSEEKANDVRKRFSKSKIDILALEKYPESFCWYGSPGRRLDDNANDRRLWKIGFKDCLDMLLTQI